jgi:uracil phosphoribosyltransferase
MSLNSTIPVSKIRLLVVLGSEQGLREIEKEHPDLEVVVGPFRFSRPSTETVLPCIHQIWVAAVDPDLTSDGLIFPGLGDTVSSAVAISS